MMPQNPLTISAEVAPTHVEGLRRWLRELGNNAANNPVLPFGRFETVHFARFLILDSMVDPDGQRLPDRLVMLAVVDGAVDVFIDALVTALPEGVDRVFGGCVAYPEIQDRDAGSRSVFLRAHNLPVNALYTNTVGRSAKQIVDEGRLRERIHQFLDSWNGGEVHPLAARQAIVDWVFAQPDLQWARSPAQRPSALWRLKEKLRFIGIALVLALLGLALLPVIVVAVLIVRFKESRDPVDSSRPALDHLEKLRAREDFGAQNQFSAAGFVKPGFLRYWIPRLALFLVQFTSRHVFNKGNLAGVPLIGLDGVDTIHFARWVFLSRRELLFASNYDGSLESYMGDFVDKVAWGLNLVFSNGVGWPRTRWLVLDGAHDEERFKDFIRGRQIETLFWYVCYPHLSAVNIANNEAIRAGLYGKLDTVAARRWLRRF